MQSLASELLDLIVVCLDNFDKHGLRRTSRSFLWVRPIRPLFPRLLVESEARASDGTATRIPHLICAKINRLLGEPDCRVLREVNKRMGAWPSLVLLDNGSYASLDAHWQKAPLGVFVPAVVLDAALV